jgi:arabinofuranosyltransferase
MRHGVSQKATLVALALLVFISMGMLALQYARVAENYMTDDAFISFRYAANLAEGHGIVWNIGDRVEGYTNFGWILALALGIKLGLEPVMSSQVLGFLASAETFALLPLVAAHLRPVRTTDWWLIVIGASAALALNTGFSVWTFAGLETTACAFFVTAGIALHLWEEKDDRRPFWSSLVFVAAAMLRPDMVVIWAVTVFFKTLRLVSRGWRSRLAGFALWVALFVGLYGGYWLWRWSYYGYFFPNTYYLRNDRSWDLINRGWHYAWSFITVYWMWLVLVALVSVWTERHQAERPARYLLAVVLAWAGYVVYSGGDWMPYYRFFVPILPIAYLLVMCGTADLVRLLTPRLIPQSLGLVTVGIVAFGVAFVTIRPYDSSVAKQTEASATEFLPGGVDQKTDRAIGSWFKGSLPADYTLALIAAGAIPYYAQLRAIDLLGVNDEHIAHLDLPLGRGPAGHEKQDGGYVISRSPEVIWLAQSFEPMARSTPEDYLPPKDTDWFPVKTAITQNRYVWLLYRPVAIRFHEGLLNLLVRQDVELPVPSSSTH